MSALESAETEQRLAWKIVMTIMFETSMDVVRLVRLNMDTTAQELSPVCACLTALTIFRQVTNNALFTILEPTPDATLIVRSWMDGSVL